MSKPSPVSAALHASFEGEFLPLLQRLGFSPAKPESVKPGYIVAFAVCALGPAGRLEATLWCDGGTGDHLRFLLYLMAPREECSKEVTLDLPWPDQDSPGVPSLGFCAGQMRPHEGIERLRSAVAFLAGAFAACSDQLAAAVPELGPALKAAAASAEWRSAAERAERLWRGRHRRGEIEERPVPASVVFVGERLLMVSAEGVRLSFRFDTRELDRTLPLSVSGWTRTVAGTPVATRLINGDRSWSFNHRGELAADAGR